MTPTVDGPRELAAVDASAASSLETLVETLKDLVHRGHAIDVIHDGERLWPALVPRDHPLTRVLGPALRIDELGLGQGDPAAGYVRSQITWSLEHAVALLDARP